MASAVAAWWIRDRASRRAPTTRRYLHVLRITVERRRTPAAFRYPPTNSASPLNNPVTQPTEASVALEGLSTVQSRIASIQRVWSPRVATAVPKGFDAALAAALDPNATVHRTVAAHDARNGRLGDADLAPIGIRDLRLAPAAADAFRRMRAAARADGVDIGATGAYRDYASQVELARRKGLYSSGGLAATPGTSQHGWGLALDVDVDAEGQAWLRANAAGFGFFEDVPREPWHWEYMHGRS